MTTDVYLTDHPVTPKDQAVAAAIHAQASPFKGMGINVEGRDNYDEMIAGFAAANDVIYEQSSLASIPGVWCRPNSKAKDDTAILFLHGGGYVMGSAFAYRHFAGQFASKTSTNVFVADYRLAPEHPFPAALDDAQAVYNALVAKGIKKIVIVGDSAGGGLSLALLNQIHQQASSGTNVEPVGCLVMSPWADLALTGASFTTRAEEEPYLSAEALENCAKSYAGAHGRNDPRISPLYGNHANLPPIQIHVGTSEILLDDSIGYAQKVHGEDGDIALHVWQGLPHVFSANIGVFEAADESMAIMAKFISSKLED